MRRPISIVLSAAALLSPPPAASAFIPRAAGPAFSAQSLRPRATTTELGIGRLFENFLPGGNNKPTETSTRVPSVSPERVLEIKSEIKDLAAGTSNGCTASEEVRDGIAALASELEGANPTPDLSTSPRMDGSWKLTYSTNGGTSAGKLGPFVGEVEQLIRIEGREDSPDYINYVRLGGGAVEGALTATWDVLAEDKWRVKFGSVTFRVLGVPLVEKELGAEGIWRMTYLDEDFRILYAAGGVNVPKENIYILAK